MSLPDCILLKISNLEDIAIEAIQDEVGTKVKEDRWLKNIDVDEIKKYASSVGETSLSNEDIAYALKFGRSVLINYSA